MIYTNEAKSILEDNKTLQDEIDRIGDILENEEEYSYSKEELNKLATKLSHLEWELKQNKELILDEII
jgi:deoxyhypusine synthase